MIYITMQHTGSWHNV